MGSQTTYSQLPYPVATDAPYVHLDIKALADRLDELLFIAAASAPPHLAGRRWFNTTTLRTWVSDGTRWTPADGGHLATAVRTTNLTGVTSEVAMSSVDFDADGITTYELEWDGSLTSSVADDRLTVYLRQGSGIAGTILANFTVLAGGVSGIGQSFHGRSLWKPAAGPQTITTTIQRFGTGTAQVLADATRPAITSVRKAF